MEDKLYISILSFKSNTLTEAGQVLQKYLDLGADPILTNADILVSIIDHTKILTKPTEYIDTYSIYDKTGHELRDWYIEIERRTDNVIQGKLIGRGVGSIRFVKGTQNDKFISSGIIASDKRSKDMILRTLERLGIDLWT